MNKKHYLFVSILILLAINNNSYAMLQRMGHLCAITKPLQNILKQHKFIHDDRYFGSKIIRFRFTEHSDCTKDAKIRMGQQFWEKYFAMYVRKIVGSQTDMIKRDKPVRSLQVIKLEQRYKQKPNYNLKVSIDLKKNYTFPSHYYYAAEQGFSDELVIFVMEKYLNIQTEYDCATYGGNDRLERALKHIAYKAAVERKETGNYPEINKNLIIRALGEPKYNLDDEERTP